VCLLDCQDEICDKNNGNCNGNDLNKTQERTFHSNAAQPYLEAAEEEAEVEEQDEDEADEAEVGIRSGAESGDESGVRSEMRGGIES
jgi:hypothetical protein